LVLELSLPCLPLFLIFPLFLNYLLVCVRVFVAPLLFVVDQLRMKTFWTPTALLVMMMISRGGAAVGGTMMMMTSSALLRFLTISRLMLVATMPRSWNPPTASSRAAAAARAQAVLAQVTMAICVCLVYKAPSRLSTLIPLTMA
jgi:hypothetical protein